MWNIKDIYNNTFLRNPLTELQQQYNIFIDKLLIPNFEKEKKDSKITFTYTPMHGVGYPYIKNVFEHVKFRVS